MAEHVTAFLPCRAGSERVLGKNTRRFAGEDGGLLAIKLRQLDRSRRIDSIVLSTNDPTVVSIAESLGLAKPLHIHHRADRLAQASTSTDELILHALDLVADGLMLWTHVTAPFVDENGYDSAVSAFQEQEAEGHDSLMSVTSLRTFIWDRERPLNYDRSLEKWPRTQTLSPLYAVNSAIFLCPVPLMRARGDRIGARPYMYPLDAIEALDIDWEEDFALAEAIARTRRSALQD